jgi:hypothetical protein
MNLSEQVCSLELAKKLLTIGVKQNSYFSWLKLTGQYEVWPTNYLNNRECAAFTIAELLYLLPRMVDTKQDEPFNTYRFKMEMMILTETNNLDDLKRVYSVNYECDTFRFSDLPIGKQLTSNIWDDNPANALAKMLIYLIENKLIEVQK